MTRDDDQPLRSGPPDLPEPPDPEKVRELREKMSRSRSAETSHADLLTGRRSRSGSRGRNDRARDLGAYTLIPMLMLAGPAVGYGLGLLVQKRWGGEPWGAVVGVLVGMVAGFRQVFLLLADIQKRNRDRDS